MHLRQEAPPLCGRDQLFFRSAFFPVKGVIDGDFCQTFLRLSPDEQRHRRGARPHPDRSERKLVRGPPTRIL